MRTKLSGAVDGADFPARPGRPLGGRDFRGTTEALPERFFAPLLRVDVPTGLRVDLREGDVLSLQFDFRAEDFPRGERLLIRFNPLSASRP
jgi:hypothetical protein